MANTQHIKEGITFHFFVHAVFVALLGAVGFVPGIPNFFRVVGIVFLALAILLLLVETGISVDKKMEEFENTSPFFPFDLESGCTCRDMKKSSLRAPKKRKTT